MRVSQQVNVFWSSSREPPGNRQAPSAPSGDRASRHADGTSSADHMREPHDGNGVRIASCEPDGRRKPGNRMTARLCVNPSNLRGLHVESDMRDSAGENHETAGGKNAPAGIRTQVIAVRGQYDWPDYTTRARICVVAHQRVHRCKVKQFRFGPAVTRFDAVGDSRILVSGPSRCRTARRAHSGATGGRPDHHRSHGPAQRT